MTASKIRVFAVCFLALGFAPRAAKAGYFEVSANGSYFSYNNGPINSVPSTTVIQRYGGGLAYHFLTNTSIELSYTDQQTSDRFGQHDPMGYDYDVQKRTRIQVTSLNLILDFADRKSKFRPYVMGGGGYMNRTITIAGTSTNDFTQVVTPLTAENIHSYSATADAGLGLKLFVADSIAIDLSLTVYGSDLNTSNVLMDYSGAAGLRILF